MLHLAAAAQCAMCREALAADQAGGGLAAGISWSILFMLALPVCILGAFGAAIWRAFRQESRRPAGSK